MNFILAPALILFGVASAMSGVSQNAPDTFVSNDTATSSATAVVKPGTSAPILPTGEAAGWN